jgi:hypothetical protein
VKLSALTVAALAMLSAPQVVRGEDSLATSLIGCWTQDPTPLEQQFEADGFFNTHTLCFNAGGQLAMDTFSSSTQSAHASEAAGLYELKGRKLLLDGGEAADGWLFERVKVNCDTAVSGQTLRLLNCIGSGPWPSGEQGPEEALDDVSFQRKVDR